MLFFRLLLPGLFAFLCMEKSLAQSIPPELENLLNKKLDSMRTVLNVKSLGASLQLSNHAVWSGASGISSTFPLDSVTSDHSYAIGSITKTLTSACILQLADEGLLNLDDSLSKWIAPIQFVNPNITIRQLLRHQSGLYDVITNPAYDAATKANLDSIWVLENVVKDYIKAPLFAAGTNWSYCNTNYLLLGIIIEKATGNPYYQEYKNRFFTPLGLNTMDIVPFDPLPVPRAHFWTSTGQDGDSFFSNWISFFTSAGPAGGYFSTPADVAIWMRAFMSGKLHSAAMMAQAKTVVTAPGLPAGVKYGLGLMERNVLGLKGYGHGGDIGYSSFSLYFPAKDVSIAVLNNDQTKTSWSLHPVIQALLKACLDYEMSVSTKNPLDAGGMKVEVSPNPFTERLTVSVDLPENVSEVTLVLTNTMGQVMTKTESLDLSPGVQSLSIESMENLSPGVYFLSIVLNGSLGTTVKVIK
jgi:D-alanyl-D-alanine carboxypeptidase